MLRDRCPIDTHWHHPRTPILCHLDSDTNSTQDGKERERHKRRKDHPDAINNNIVRFFSIDWFHCCALISSQTSLVSLCPLFRSASWQHHGIISRVTWWQGPPHPGQTGRSGRLAACVAIMGVSGPLFFCAFCFCVSKKVGDTNRSRELSYTDAGAAKRWGVVVGVR